jgi:hypothetical protein
MYGNTLLEEAEVFSSWGFLLHSMYSIFFLTHRCKFHAKVLNHMMSL